RGGGRRGHARVRHVSRAGAARDGSRQPAARRRARRVARAGPVGASPGGGHEPPGCAPGDPAPERARRGARLGRDGPALRRPDRARLPARVLMPLFGPLAGTILAFGSSVLWLYMTEGRQRREIGRMFSQYVSPAVVQELQRHPEKLKLGGERREMTAFFSDIEGFTTVTESMSPTELVAFLNTFLTRSTAFCRCTPSSITHY